MYLPDEVKEEMQRNILSRLRKIEGQIRGLQGMVSSGKECEQILTQLRAAQSALKSVTGLVLKSYLTKCYCRTGREPQPRRDVPQARKDRGPVDQVHRGINQSFVSAASGPLVLEAEGVGWRADCRFFGTIMRRSWSWLQKAWLQKKIGPVLSAPGAPWTGLIQPSSWTSTPPDWVRQGSQTLLVHLR